MKPQEATAQRRFVDLLAVRAAARTVSLRTELLLLALILAVAAALRFATITSHSVWVDEAYTYAITQLPSRHLIEVPFDTHPALFFLLQQWLPVGPGDAFSLRLIPALTSLAGLATLYLFARWLMGNVGALTVTALNAAAYTNLVFANDARNYPLLLLFLFLAFGALLQVSRRILPPGSRPDTPALGWAALYTFGSLGALYTHHIAVFGIFAANAAMLTLYSASLRSAVQTGLRLIGLNLVVVLAWLPLVLNVSSVTDSISWLEQAGPGHAAYQVAAMILPNRTGAVLLLLYALALLVAGALVIRRRGPALHAAAALVILYPLLVWGVGFVFQPAFLPRTILPVLAGSTLLIGAAAAYAARPALAASIAGAALLATTVSAAGYLTRDLSQPNVDNGQPIQDWREAVTATQAGEGPGIVLCSPYWLPSITFYAPEARIYIAGRDAAYWPITEDQWRIFYGLPPGERSDNRGAVLETILAASGSVPLGAGALADRHPTLALVEVNAYRIQPCSGDVLDEFAALTGGAAPEKAHTGLTTYSLTRRAPAP